ncbi:helix-turn-helix domain-containing protein [Enhygromyxa salina]|uniref:Helix-turn-helix domain protein n=1 Tax=Enhygromyxa salina TaxID=215803 RepID=A0A2S9Y0A3_9BACT|nr:helix-turn-helix domain-containing protein [Enhygromyxa salina]PRP98519.1 Helix-turn-helix domain protein [Enhygromyxa salina]
MPPRRTPGDAPHLPYLLCVDEVATLLRVTRKAVYCMIDRGELPGVTKIGRRVRFHRDSLLDWLESQRVVLD